MIGGSKFLIKVGTDVQQVQKISQENLIPRQKRASKPDHQSSFHEI